MNKRLPKIISLPKILDDRGNLSFFEASNQIPFLIERAYWIYDVPGGEVRGGHAFEKQKELIIALSGSVSINILDSNGVVKTFNLSRSYEALYVPQGLWRYMDNFATNTVVLIASDSKYNESDYIRDWDMYKKSNKYVFADSI